MARPAIVPEVSSVDPYDPGRSLFARLGGILLPATVLLAALGVRLDSWIALPAWLRAALFLAVGMTIGLAIWGWIALRPRRLGLALAATGLAAASIVVLPDLGRNLARFVVPWYTSPTAPARIVVPYPTPLVPRGQPLTIVAYIEGNPPTVDSVFQIDVKTNKLDEKARAATILPDARGLYRYSWQQVFDPFSYRLRFGTLATDWFEITPVDPVELRPDSTITLRRADSPSTATSQPFHDHHRLQLAHGDEVRLDLRFTQSPAAARLEWQPTIRFDERPAAPQQIPLITSVERTQGTAVHRPQQSGHLRLQLAEESGYLTEYRLEIDVVPARPVELASIDGLSRFLNTIDPDNPPSFTVTIHKTDRINDPVLELRRGPAGNIQSIPGKRSGNTIQFPLQLPLDIAENEPIEVRLTATIQPADGEPSTIHFPAATWLPLRVQRPAVDPVEQETAAAQEWLVSKLRDQRKQLLDALSIVKRIRSEADQVSGWNIDHSVRLKTARNELSQMIATSQEITEEFRRLHTWALVAQGLDSTIKTDLFPAETALEHWSRQTDPRQMRTELDRAVQHLEQGRDRFEKLIETTERIAALRVTARKLQRQRDALANADASKIDREEFLRSVVSATRANPELTSALSRLRTEDWIQIADELARIHEEQQRLHRAMLRTEAEHRDRLLQSILKQQQEIATELAALRTATALPLHLASAAPLSPDSGLQALQHLKDHQTATTLAEQEKTARELDRIATVLAKAATARSDHREAVRQLSVWQLRIRTRLADATESRPTNLPQLATEQQSIATTLEAISAEHLPLPVITGLKAAQVSTKHAAEAFRTNSLDLDDMVMAADQSLQQLAESFPTNTDRWRTTRTTLERLRHEHRSVSADLVQLKTDSNDPQRRTLVQRIEQMANKVETLDVPGLGHRRRAAMEAYQQAAGDLRLGHGADAAIMLRQAGRHLDRLLQALDGKTPDDERARELASLQSELEKSLLFSPSPPGSDQRKSAATVQLELARQYQSLSAPEAIPPLERVREAARRAGQLAITAPPEELLPALREAATAARQLAETVTGVETDLDRAKRLAANLEQAAKQVRQQSPAASGPREVSRILLELRDLASDFERTRAGRAQVSRTAAATALQQLRESDPARPDPTRYRAAAEVFRRLAEEMAGQPESAQSLPLPLPSAESDPGQSSLPGTLPRLEDAHHAAQLAERQRRLRDLLSQRNATISLGFTPAEEDPIQELIAAIESFDPVPAKLAGLYKLVPELRVGDPDTVAKVASLLEDPGLKQRFRKPPDKITPVEILAARQAHRQEELVATCQQWLTILDRLDPLAGEPIEGDRESQQFAIAELKNAIRAQQAALRIGHSARQRELAALARTSVGDHLKLSIEKLREISHDSTDMPPLSRWIRVAATEMRTAVLESDWNQIERHLDRAIQALDRELTGTE